MPDVLTSEELDAQRPPRRWALNLYAIAEQVIGKPIDWPTVVNLNEQLQEAFKEQLQRVFEPDPSAPTLIDALEYLLANAAAFHDVDAVLGRLPPALRVAVKPYANEALERLLPFYVNVENLPLRWRAPGATSAPAQAIDHYAMQGKLIGNGQVSYLDPVQGHAADCGLIATMIATAWMGAGRWQDRLEKTGYAPPTQPGLSWRFYAAGEPSVVATDADLPLDRCDMPLYARSAERGEIWPALVEKAYAMWRAPTDANPDAAAYQSIGHEEVTRVMRALWGAPAWRNEDALLVERLLGNKGAYPLLDARGVTVFPTVAWTCPTAGQTLPARTGLTPRHAYAVLGRAADVDGAGYVVLRNPHDSNPNLVAKYMQKPWKPHAAEGGDPVILNRNCVFAIPEDWLNKYFEGVAWLKW